MNHLGEHVRYGWHYDASCRSSIRGSLRHRHRMNRFAVALALGVVGAVGAGLVVTNWVQSHHGDRIGAILPLTGDLAKFGESFRRGMTLAVDDSKTKISVIYDDDAGDAGRGATAFVRLVDAENVPAVVGAATSPVAMAVSPIADRRQVVVVSPAATAPALSRYHYFFRVMPSDSYEGTVMARFVSQSLHHPTVAIVYVNNDWGDGLRNVFADAYRKSGGTIVGEYAFERQQTDFRALISLLKGTNTQYIYLLGYLKELVAFQTEATELALGRKYLGAFSMDDPDLIARVPAASLRGSFVTVPAYDPNNPRSAVTRDFIQRYLQRYGTKPDQFAAHGYDSAMVVAAAIRSGARTGPAIRAFLDGRSFDGVTGPFTFKGGDVKKAYRIMEFANDSFVERGYVTE